MRMTTLLRFVVTVLTVSTAAAHASAGEPLTSAHAILRLTRHEAAQTLPVTLKGVVVYSGGESLVVHDGSDSVYADFRFSREKGVWKGKIPNLDSLIPGAVVEVEGVTDPGGFSPMVLVEAYRHVGSRPIPRPLEPSLETLLSASLDCQWVEVEGVVRRLDRTKDHLQYLAILVGGQTVCPVILRHPWRGSDSQLVDGRVRVRGVVFSMANLRSQSLGISLQTNGPDDIKVTIPPPADPFLAPKVSLDRLIEFQPDADIGHRRVSRGVVTFAVPGRFFYVFDQGVSVRVDSAATTVMPGDRVEFSGFIDTSRIFASFAETLVRKVGTGTVPPPEEPSISAILEPETRSAWEMVLRSGRSDFNGRVIRVTGFLRGMLPPDGDGNVTVVIESGTHLVRALLAGPGAACEAGSLVEVTGVCELEMKRIASLPWFAIDGFHLWLSSPDDVRVLASPPWWTTARLGILLGTVVVGLGLALAWGYALRRQVAIRSGELAAEIAARESAQLEFDAILRERRRLANDLHDTLEQSLVGLALQLEIASRASDLTARERHLNLARQFLERSRMEVHRTVWDLHAYEQAGRSFMEIVHDRVTSMADGTGVTITLNNEGDETRLPDLIAGHLLLLIQEAVTNALKHSGATAIRVMVRLTRNRAELEIHDNGRGFDPALAPGQAKGHFGLQGMRERVKRLGGHVEFRTAPGAGTTIHVRIPLPDA